ncbi:MAG: hypothetical protein ACE5GN_07025 [Waddliaceae bacterium]
MGFERFTKVGVSYKPRISIRANGQFGFTAGAVKKFHLNDYKFAVLFYDKEASRIGIKLTNEPEEGICRLQVKSTNAFLSARAFLDYYGIDYGETKRYDAEWSEEDEMVVIALA